MKAVLFALVAAVAVSASAKTITVRVCEPGDRGETVCKTVTYKDRGASAPVQQSGPEMCVGDREPVPCPTRYGVPAWLKSVNQWFLDHGATIPADNKYDPSGA